MYRNALYEGKGFNEYIYVTNCITLYLLTPWWIHICITCVYTLVNYWQTICVAYVALLVCISSAYFNGIWWAAYILYLVKANVIHIVYIATCFSHVVSSLKWSHQFYSKFAFLFLSIALGTPCVAIKSSKHFIMLMICWSLFACAFGHNVCKIMRFITLKYILNCE